MIEQAQVTTLHRLQASTQITNAGAAVDLSNAHDLIIVAEVAKGDAATLGFHVQRDDADGADWVAIANNMRRWVATDVSDSDALVRQTGAVNYTTAATQSTHRVVFQVNPSSLGVHPTTDNPCTQVRVNITSGNADDRGSVTAYVIPSRYKP